MQVQIYDDYVKLFSRIADLQYSAAVLQWDQETYLPVNGNDRRGQQMATLQELAHQLFTQESTGQLLNHLFQSSQLNEHQRQNIRLSLEDFRRNQKIPSEFVRKMSEATNQSFHAWIEARKKNDFHIFQEPLQQIILLKRKEAEMLGYEKHPYDALMNDYDKGLTVELTDQLFDRLKIPLQALIQKIGTVAQNDHAFLNHFYPKDSQWDFGIRLLKNMGFDFNSGRQDISEHPFTTNFSSRDVRLTTRIDEYDLANMIWSCIHEGGHGLYEQGLPDEEYGLPGGSYASLSIHESQSRLWENCIGRGLPFWSFHYPDLQKTFPNSLVDTSLQDFYRGINTVKPSLIRTEADELTYHFHVMIRYEIEKMLIEGTINAIDIPAIWNEKYQQYLNIKVPDDKQGCLQDVHWSHGSFGYFATYSIGSLYAAQLWNTINQEALNLNESIMNGDTNFVHSWLKKHIYARGKHLRSEELCIEATGEKLNADFFIKYATQKYSELYGWVG